LSSEWVSVFSLRLKDLKIEHSAELHSVLKQHGWNGNQFKGPPSRQHLLDDLRREKQRCQSAPSRTQTFTNASPPKATLPEVHGSAGSLAVDPENPQNITEYVSDIFSNMHLGEERYMPQADYMEMQTDVNAKMRAILVDWLVEVHSKYQLRHVTLFTTVNLVDRYLTKTVVIRKRLQLVGVAAMFVAAKLEEINPPELQDFVFITDNAYTKQELLLMECTMLTALEFDVSFFTAVHFLDRLLPTVDNEVQRQVVEYLLELALVDVKMVKYPPSHLAAAALFLSNQLLATNAPTWSVQLANLSRYTDTSLRPAVDELRGLLQAVSESSLQAVFKKYSRPEHHAVARMTFF